LKTSADHADGEVGLAVDQGGRRLGLAAVRWIDSHLRLEPLDVVDEVLFAGALSRSADDHPASSGTIFFEIDLRRCRSCRAACG